MSLDAEVEIRDAEGRTFLAFRRRDRTRQAIAILIVTMIGAGGVFSARRVLGLDALIPVLLLSVPGSAALLYFLLPCDPIGISQDAEGLEPFLWLRRGKAGVGDFGWELVGQDGVVRASFRKKRWGISLRWRFSGGGGDVFAEPRDWRASGVLVAIVFLMLVMWTGLWFFCTAPLWFVLAYLLRAFWLHGKYEFWSPDSLRLGEFRRPLWGWFGQGEFVVTGMDPETALAFGALLTLDPGGGS